MHADLRHVWAAFNETACRVAVSTCATTRALPCGLELDLSLTVIDRSGTARRVVRRCDLGDDLATVARRMGSDFAASRAALPNT